MVLLAIQNEDYAQTSLTPTEGALFDKQFNDLFMPAWSLERQFIGSKMNLVRTALEVAKNSLEELTFGGLNCGNGEIGFSMIRPGHVGLVEGAVPESNNVWPWKHDCVKIVNAVGFENWIHSPTTATTAFAVNHDEFVYPMYIAEETTNAKIQCVKMDIGRTNVLWYDVVNCRLTTEDGLDLIPLPTTFWLPDTDAILALGFMAAGYVAPRLGGFTVAKGSFLNATNYIAATNSIAAQIVAST